MIFIIILWAVIGIKTRRQVNIRLSAYVDNLLNAIADKSNMSKTDIINLGIERVAVDVLGADLVNEIRLKQFNGGKI